jgi:hypothetical protein
LAAWADPDRPAHIDAPEKPAPPRAIAAPAAPASLPAAAGFTRTLRLPAAPGAMGRSLDAYRAMPVQIAARGPAGGVARY